MSCSNVDKLADHNRIRTRQGFVCEIDFEATYEPTMFFSASKEMKKLPTTQEAQLGHMINFAPSWKNKSTIGAIEIK